MSPAGASREGFARRLQVAFIVTALGFGAIAGCYWYLQIVRGGYYFQLSENNRLRSVAIPAARGVIYDRHGSVIAENEPSYSLFLYRRETKNLQASLDAAISLLQLDREDVEKRVARYRTYFDFVPIDLADNLTLPEVARIESHLPEHPEFAVGVGQKRLYPMGNLATQSLGYLAEASSRQIAAAPDRYHPGMLVGQRGIESSYQDILAGRDGERRIIVNSFGHEISEESREDPLPGRNLTLTIDDRLQRVAEIYFQGHAGAAVAMDPKTGQILAISSSPSYDPNIFSGRISPDEWRKIINDPLRPLQNRAIQNVYSPGSTFKVFEAAGALADDVVTPATKIFCPGEATFYGRPFRCHKRGGHGWEDLRHAIRDSCDVYFYTVGKELGIERIGQIARAFGFGSPTGVDLPDEKSGLVPSPQWSLLARHSRWYPSETISVAIGQGPLLVSTLQMARALAGLVEGGLLPRPHLFFSAEDPATRTHYIYQEKPRRNISLMPDIVNAVKDGMWAVVNDPHGTAYNARIPGLDFCGKTGSVQVVTQKNTSQEALLPYNKRDHAWFIGFAPKDDPKIVVAVFVEHGQHGSSAAAPLARDLVKAFFGMPVPELEPPPPAAPPGLLAQGSR